MHLSQITLRDWKAYTAATFHFPAPTEDKNIILIGAQNGYGKTSLFEAIVLGMYGRIGMELIAPRADTTKAEPYVKFLQKALHRGAIAEERTSCSVKIVFINDDYEPLEIIRTWHFTDSGNLRKGEEEIRVYEGLTRKPIGPPPNSLQDRSQWFTDYINMKLLPFTLAHFFMFDGEQVSALAERDMSWQVRNGIEELLGIKILKNLAFRLRRYGDAQRKKSPNVTQSIESMEQVRNRLESDYKDKETRLSNIKNEQNTLKKKREDLYRELMNYGAGSQALLQGQFEKASKLEQNIENEEKHLEDLMMGDLALALSGPLRKNVKARLQSEADLERWEAGKKQGDSKLERFINLIDSGLVHINPSLDVSQREGILKCTKSAWGELWNPRPDNCAKDYLHPYMSESDRSKVIDLLHDLDNLGTPGIVGLLRNITTKTEELKRLREEIHRIEDVPQADEKKKLLNELDDEIDLSSKNIGALEREVKALKSQIDDENAKINRQLNISKQGAPAARRAAQAYKVAKMVDQIVARTVPSQVDDVAAKMTEAHLFMAHKKDLVERISIDKNCDVKLLNASGLDLRDYDLSAGEKQIFTQALFSAVTSVSGWHFPMVIDTPLGRLDIEHRKNVLKHLANPNHQIILLSTNTEVVGEYLQEILPHVLKKYVVHFERVGDIGRSSVEIGYFETET